MMSENVVYRAVAYCRVSTDKEDQKNSFESQKRYFLSLAQRDPRLVLTEIFADEGTSGTSTKKRHAFLRMMAAAREGKFDLILTKEISRFARNTLDSIRYTRELKKLGVGVIFLADGIDTRDGDAELRLAILSSIAQEESRKTSERVKWGQKRRMEEGVVFGRSMLGYDVQNGVITKNEKDAVIVREIFRKYTEEGKGTHVIARELREANIVTPHVKNWTAAGIFRILKNEKYCGDLVQKKTYTPDYLTHEKKYNHGAEALIICRDHHEPIVSREIFMRAQARLSRGQSAKEKKRSVRHAFSGRIFCGVCGKALTAKRANDGGTVFRCQNGECSMHFGLRERTAVLLANKAFLALDFSREKICRGLTSALCKCVNPSKNENSSARLIALYAEGEITREEFLEARKKYGANAVERSAAKERKQKIENEIVRLLSGAGDDDFFRRLGIMITVFSKERMEISFSGLPYTFLFSAVGRGDLQTVFLHDIFSVEKTIFDSENGDFY